MLAIILAGAAVVRERDHGTMDHLLVMPVSPFEIAVSKSWANGLVILIAVGMSQYFVVRALALAAQTGTYVSASLAWARTLRRAGHPRSLRLLVPLGVAKLFTDQVVPTSDVSGAVLVTRALPSRRADRRGDGSVAGWPRVVLRRLSDRGDREPRRAWGASSRECGVLGPGRGICHYRHRDSLGRPVDERMGTAVVGALGKRSAGSRAFAVSDCRRPDGSRARCATPRPNGGARAFGFCSRCADLIVGASRPGPAAAALGRVRQLERVCVR